VVDGDTDVVATYDADWFTGAPAITRRRTPGGGQCWYIGTHLDDAGYDAVLGSAVAPLGIIDPRTNGPDGVEQTARLTPDGRLIRFVLNQNDEPVTLPSSTDGRDLLTDRLMCVGEPFTLDAHGVAVIDTSAAV
jgi:beta-galactosidase